MLQEKKIIATVETPAGIMEKSNQKEKKGRGANYNADYRHARTGKKKKQKEGYMGYV
jgi:hypothetical protein